MRPTYWGPEVIEQRHTVNSAIRWTTVALIISAAVVLQACRQGNEGRTPAPAVVVPPTDPQPTADTTGEDLVFLRQMNTSKARLENGSFDDAIKGFTTALEMDPESGPAARNLARALLFAGRMDQAIEELDELEQHDADIAAIPYLKGIVYARQVQFDSAVPYFEQAVRLDSGTAAIRYQLAQAYTAVGRSDEAFEQLREAVRLDPQHTAAQYQLAMRAKRADDTEEFRRRLHEFKRLRNLYGDPLKTPLALEACVHTQAESAEQKAAVLSPTQPINVQFTDVTEQAFAGDATRSASAIAIIEMDEHGQYTFFVADNDGGLSLMTLPTDGVSEREELEVTLPADLNVHHCVVGNFMDRGDVRGGSSATSRRYADVFLLGEDGSCLLNRADSTVFEDVTRSSGLSGVAGQTARWVDYEYDGDLDLMITGKAGLQLWQNNGDSRFQLVTSDVGIAPSTDGTDIGAADLDSNGGVDIIAAHGAAPTRVHENQRAGRFRAMPEPPGPWPAARRVFVNDIDNDGESDVMLAGAAKATILFGRSDVRQHIDLSGIDLAAGVLFDYDNDGWLDFCGVGQDQSKDKGALRIWRNEGASGWRDVTQDLSISTATPAAPLRHVIAADVDADGDSDLLLLDTGNQLHLLRNDGGHVNGQLKLRLVSAVIGHGGIGVRVEVRSGDYRVTRSVPQPTPIEIGLHGRTELDTVQTVWPDGTVHNQIKVELTRDPLDIVVAAKTLTGSCPYLFAWDGERFRFVTDLVGSGATGLSLSRDTLWQPDPYEIVLIGTSDQFPPHDGRYTINVTSELREVAYFDHLRLLAVDHLDDVEVHPTDKFMLPPFADSQLWSLHDSVPLVHAADHDGIDRTETVQSIDGVFAPSGRPLPAPLRGMCEPSSLTLDFGELDPDRPLVLAMTGWLAFGDASSNIALSQNRSVEVIWPTLEAETADGRWVALDVNVGMPAGKTKTIVCDLSGQLPHGVKRLRLTTTFEIHWDRIAAFERSAQVAQVHELPLDTAYLGWRGFSDLATRRPGHPMTPDYNTVSDQPPWRTTLEGWCTRYGDVRELIEHDDGKIVILNGGDAMELSGAADVLPDPPRGMVRTFFLSSVGWNREDNANAVGGDRVHPLPRDPDAADRPDWDEEDDWRLRYNTRWVPRNRFHPARRNMPEDSVRSR